MKLWTIQTYKKWIDFKKTGVLQANKNYIEKEFLPAYQWMAGKMKLKLGYKPEDVDYPIWAWYQWKGVDKKKPDLRYKGHLPKGQKGVLIEFEVNENEVLLSDFYLWHYVLNYWYIPENEKDDEKFEQELKSKCLNIYTNEPLPEPYHSKVVKSWDRIFDLNFCNNYIFGEIREEKSIQATLWELELWQVKNVKKFISK